MRQCFRQLVRVSTLAMALGACGQKDISPVPTPGTTGTSTSADATAGAIPASIGPFTDTSAGAMLTQLQTDYKANSGYRTWKTNGVHWVNTLKAYGATYQSATLAQAVAAGDTAYPVGASSVLELYADAAGKSLSGWAVLAKGAAASGASSWFSYEITGTNGQFGAPKVNDMGDATCANCHAPVPGYIIPM